MSDDELAACLRSWRERVRPADVGLPSGGHRRTPGLRREEVAQLTGLSVDYLARLEQGRATRPSAQVLDALARTLRVTDAEREHLFRVAGQVVPCDGHMRRHLTPSIQRILDRLSDTPVLVNDAAWNLLAWNQMAAALLGDFSQRPPRERNVAWRIFTRGPENHDPEHVAVMKEQIVGSLHDALGRHCNDPELNALIDDLRAASPEFAALWEERPVGRHAGTRKTLDHPVVGPITLDCDVLKVAGTDLELVVYSAEPGSEDETKLRLLATVGLQTFG